MFNQLINSKVSSRLIELLVIKPKVLREVLYPFKSIIKGLIVILPRYYIVEVAINLILATATNIIPNDVNRSTT